MPLSDLQIWSITPEIIVATMACAILMVDVFIPERSRKTIGFGLTVSTLLLAAIAVAVGQDAGYTIGLYGLVVQDRISDISKLSICLITAVVLVYGRGYTEQYAPVKLADKPIHGLIHLARITGRTNHILNAELIT